MMSDACRDGLPVSCQCGCGEVGHRMAHGVVTSAVKTSISATSDSSSSFSSRARCANSSFVSTFRVPNRAGRWRGTPTISTPGQNPCRSGSPHGVLGGTKPGAGWGMGSAAEPAIRVLSAAGRWASIATDPKTHATRRATRSLFMACSRSGHILAPFEIPRRTRSRSPLRRATGGDRREGTMKLRTLVRRSALVALTLLAAATPARADDIKVFSSVAMRAVVEEVAARFERDTGHRVVATFGLAAVLKGRIESGESYDLAILTPAQADELIAGAKAA